MDAENAGGGRTEQVRATVELFEDEPSRLGSQEAKTVQSGCRSMTNTVEQAGNANLLRVTTSHNPRAFFRIRQWMNGTVRCRRTPKAVPQDRCGHGNKLPPESQLAL